MMTSGDLVGADRPTRSENNGPEGEELHRRVFRYPRRGGARLDGRGTACRRLSAPSTGCKEFTADLLVKQAAVALR